MHEHRQPGRGSLVADDSSGHHATATHEAGAVGKTTRTQGLEQPELEASAASVDYRDRIVNAFDNAGTNWTFVFNERHDAVGDVQTRLTLPKHPPSPGLLQQIASAALGVVTDAIMAKLSSLVINEAVGLTKKFLHDHSPHDVAPNDAGAVQAFSAMQRGALNKASKTAQTGLNNAKANLLEQFHNHKVSGHDALQQARSIEQAFNKLGKEAYELQYNSSLIKWFSALSQASFGSTPPPKNGKQDHKASNLAGHLHTDQPGFPGTPNYGHYGQAVGFVHLKLHLGYTHALQIDDFQIPGIDSAAWDYARPGENPLGKLKLAHLPQGQHLPVIADIKFNLQAGTKGIKQHLPFSDTGQTIQPIAMSWNETGQINAQLPATDSYDGKLTGGDRTWLDQQVGHAVHRNTAQEAAERILREVIGDMSLDDIRNAKNGKTIFHL